jgi:predicted transcriptional regulator
LDVLFPKVRAAVLRLLFTKRKTECYVRQLAHESSFALGTVQQELAKLSACGLIMSRSDGYRHFYRANRAHPIFRDLQRMVHESARAKAVTKKRRRRNQS